MDRAPAEAEAAARAAIADVDAGRRAAPPSDAAGRRTAVRGRRDRRPARRRRRPGTRGGRRGRGRGRARAAERRRRRPRRAARGRGLRERAHAAALAVPRVREVHNLCARRRRRPHRAVAAPEAARRPVARGGARIAERVERAIRAAVPEIAGVQTHIEPLAEAATHGARGRRRREAVVRRVVREATGHGAARAPVPAHRRRASSRSSRSASTARAASTMRTLGRARSRSAIRRERPDIADVIVHTEPCRFTAVAPRREALHVHAAGARLERGWPGADRGRPRDPARGADAAVVLHRRRLGARARRVRARRRRAATAGAASARGARLHGVRAARRDRARGSAAPRCRRSGTRSRSSTSPTRPRSTGRTTTSPYPEGTSELDYELECAAIIGAEGRIGGFTVLNDWSARDLQRAEMRVGLGPAKGKDFATSLGPILVTPDEFDGSERRDGRARQRRGALARQPRATCTTLGRAARAGGAQHRSCGPAT